MAIEDAMKELFQRIAGPANHISDGLLVKHADGELPQREVDRVNAHLKYCWSCRTRRDRIEQAISDVVQYQDRQLRPYLPPAAGGRSMFLARLDQLATQETSESWWHQVLSSIGPVSGWRFNPVWTRVAIATCVLLVTLIFLPRTQKISAAELLQRTRSAEIQSLSAVVQPVIFQKLNIRAAGHSVTRTIYRDTASRRRKDQLALDTGTIQFPVSAAKSATAANEPEDLKQVQNALEQEFVAANLNWLDPLSVSAYKTWHNGLQQRKEDVTSICDELLLTTSTPEGPIAEASLRVRERDFHAVAESVRLRDNREIEIAEIEYQLIPGSMASDIFPAEPPPARVNTAPVPSTTVAEPPPSAPSEAELAEAEVQALVALHAVGADLGEPVEIVRTQTNIEARGLADTAERKAQLHAALNEIPNLAFRIKTVAEASKSVSARGNPARGALTPPEEQAAGQKGAASVAVVAGKPPLQDHLITYFASKQPKESLPAASAQDTADSIQREVQGLSRQAIALSEKEMSEAWALRRLAKRYTPEELGKLSPKARGELENIIRDHVRALKGQFSQSRALLVPALESIPRMSVAGSMSRPPVKDLSPGWPDFPLALFDLVNHADRITNGLLAGAGLPVNLEGSPAGRSPLRIKSPEEHAADLLFLYQWLDRQFPRLEANIAGPFL